MAWGRKDGYVSPFDSNDPDGYVNPGESSDIHHNVNVHDAGQDSGHGGLPNGNGAASDEPFVAPTPYIQQPSSYGQPLPSAPDATFGSGAGAAPDATSDAGMSPVPDAPWPKVDVPEPVTGPASHEERQSSVPADAPAASPSAGYSAPTSTDPVYAQYSSPVPVIPSSDGPSSGTPADRSQPSSPFSISTPPTGAGPKSDGGKPMTPLERANAAEKAKSRKSGVFRVVWIVVVAAIVLEFTPITGFFKRIFGGSQNDSSYSTTNSFNSSNTEEEKEIPRWKTQNSEGTVSNYEAANLNVSIDKAVAGPNDNEGKATVIITYTWTNTASEAKQFSSMVEDDAYQNGVGLRSVYLYDGDLPAGYVRDADSANVQSGASQTLSIAYRLRDQQQDVAVTLTGQSNRGSDIVATVFQHGANGTYTSTGKAPESIKNGGEAPEFMNYTIEGVPKAGIKDADGYSGKLLGSYGAVTQMSIESIKRLPGATYDGKDLVVVTYRWRNDGERPWQFYNAVQENVYQNGVECQVSSPGYGKVPDTDYDSFSENMSVLPGSTYDTTVAYAVSDVNGPVDVQVKGYVNDESVTLERTFKQ